MTTTLLIEVQRAGPRGRRIYRQTNLEFVRPAVLRFIEAVLGRIGSESQQSEHAEHSVQERSSRRVSR